MRLSIDSMHPWSSDSRHQIYLIYGNNQKLVRKREEAKDFIGFCFPSVNPCKAFLDFKGYHNKQLRLPPFHWQIKWGYNICLRAIKPAKYRTALNLAIILNPPFILLVILFTPFARFNSFLNIPNQSLQASAKMQYKESEILIVFSVTDIDYLVILLFKPRVVIDVFWKSYLVSHCVSLKVETEDLGWKFSIRNKRPGTLVERCHPEPQHVSWGGQVQFSVAFILCKVPT